MTTVALAPLVLQQFNQNGIPVSGGLLFTYSGGTTTKLATYTDSTGSTPNANPVVLDANGQAPVWMDVTKTYKFTLSPSTDTDPPAHAYWTEDYITTLPSIAALAQMLSAFLIVTYDIAESFKGKPTTSQQVLRLPMVRVITFPVDFASSKVSAAIAATASTTFNIAKNGVNFGTMVFALGATTATFSAATPPVFNPGDVLTVTGPASADATLSDIGFILCGQVVP